MDSWVYSHAKACVKCKSIGRLGHFRMYSCEEGRMDLLTRALRTTHHNILVKNKNLSKAIYIVEGMVLKKYCLQSW